MALVVFAAFAWGLAHLAAGRAVYATGSDAEAARLAGIRPRRVVFGGLRGHGRAHGPGGLLTAIQFIDVQANAGVGLELQVIAAVVVGGIAISGGRGTLRRHAARRGVCSAVVGPALIFLGTQAHWDGRCRALIILVAVAGRCVRPAAEAARELSAARPERSAATSALLACSWLEWSRLRRPRHATS